jgi:hypothetical protein
VRIVGAAACFLAVVLLSPTALGSPSGTYRVTGTNPADNAPYEGTVTVTASGGAYAVEWHIAGNTIRGTGLDNGVSFAVIYDIGGSYGVALYTSTGGGNWQGIWTQYGQSHVGVETWTAQ